MVRFWLLLFTMELFFYATRMELNSLKYKSQLTQCGLANSALKSSTQEITYLWRVLGTRSWLSIKWLVARLANRWELKKTLDSIPVPSASTPLASTCSWLDLIKNWHSGTKKVSVSAQSVRCKTGSGHAPLTLELKLLLLELIMVDSAPTKSTSIKSTVSTRKDMLTVNTWPTSSSSTWSRKPVSKSAAVITSRR